MSVIAESAWRWFSRREPAPANSNSSEPWRPEPSNWKPVATVEDWKAEWDTQLCQIPTGKPQQLVLHDCDITKSKWLSHKLVHLLMLWIYDLPDRGETQTPAASKPLVSTFTECHSSTVAVKASADALYCSVHIVCANDFGLLRLFTHKKTGTKVIRRHFLNKYFAPISFPTEFMLVLFVHDKGDTFIIHLPHLTL